MPFGHLGTIPCLGPSSRAASLASPRSRRPVSTPSCPIYKGFELPLERTLLLLKSVGLVPSLAGETAWALDCPGPALQCGLHRCVASQIDKYQYITDWLTLRSDAPIVNHMVEQSGQLDAVFHALAHDARRDMLRRLADRELTVGELADPLEMSLPAASKHLRVLEGAGLVQRTVMGRRHVCRLDPGPLAGADEWLRFYERYWNEQLDALERIFDGDSADDDAKGDR